MPLYGGFYNGGNFNIAGLGSGLGIGGNIGPIIFGSVTGRRAVLAGNDGDKKGISLAGAGAMHATHIGMPGVANANAKGGIVNLTGKITEGNVELALNLTAFAGSSALKVGDDFVVLGADGYGGVTSLYLRF